MKKYVLKRDIPYINICTAFQYTFVEITDEDSHVYLNPDMIMDLEKDCYSFYDIKPLDHVFSENQVIPFQRQFRKQDLYRVPRLYLFVNPKDRYSLSLQTKLGNIHINQGCFEHIHLENQKGNIWIQNLHCKKLKIRKQVGEISMIDSQAQYISIQNDQGRTFVKNTDIDKMELLSNMGDLDIVLKENYPCYSIKASTMGNMKKEDGPHLYMLPQKNKKSKIIAKTNFGNISLSTQKQYIKSRRKRT